MTAAVAVAPALGRVAAVRAALTSDTPAVIWTLLLINTTPYFGGGLLPVPVQIGKAVAMAALVVAFGLVVAWNPKLLIRPNIVLTLFTLLVIAASASSVRLEAGAGSLWRCSRLGLFVATLWLLSPAWREPLALVRAHIRACLAVQVLVILGVFASGGRSLRPRLVGTLWPMPASEVSQFTAIGTGLLVAMWLAGQVSGRSLRLLVPGSVVMLLLAHSRTAIFALLIALTVAAGTSLLSNRRAGRFLAGMAALGAVGAVVATPFVLAWLQRGQTSQGFSQLSGRTVVWTNLLNQPRTLEQRVFGHGLSDKSFGGRPIDDAWLAVYHEQGYIGLALYIGVFLVLLFAVISARPSPGRTVAAFLVSYLAVVSYTEVGFGDASPYLLVAVLAAALVHNPRGAQP
jgi:O-antigen ligase